MIKDLFKAVQNERTMIKRFCNLRDRNNMLDHRCDALAMVSEFDREYGLSKDMKKFLVHRICTAASETGLM
ncbi:MAG: hypothetical protein IJV71_05650 [Lachnospiraceae bacterium]|nr:hypothetical protein [Lachnospiraceae bacterium]